jgi:hypothetical protein
LLRSLGRARETGAETSYVFGAGQRNFGTAVKKYEVQFQVQRIVERIKQSIGIVCVRRFRRSW